MDALEEEAAVSCWRPVGAQTGWKLGLIRMCAWWLVALATLENYIRVFPTASFVIFPSYLWS